MNHPQYIYIYIYSYVIMYPHNKYYIIKMLVMNMASLLYTVANTIKCIYESNRELLLHLWSGEDIA